MADKRILTTHAGSLPRPARLVELYATRAKGEKIDEAELVREGEAATRWVVEKQREAGIDIPSDGEQLREAFFLYVQRRMTGFSGKWKRPHGGELDAYPEYAERRRQQIAVDEPVLLGLRDDPIPTNRVVAPVDYCPESINNVGRGPAAPLVRVVDDHSVHN